MARHHSIRVTTLAVGGLWLAGGSAQAFFPPLPLGSGSVTVVPQPLPVATDGGLTPVPPVQAPPFTPPPPRVVVPQDIPNPPRPQTVPEPASVVSAIAGLSLVTALRRRRAGARSLR